MFRLDNLEGEGEPAAEAAVDVRRREERRARLSLAGALCRSGRPAELIVDGCDSGAETEGGAGLEDKPIAFNRGSRIFRDWLLGGCG